VRPFHGRDFCELMVLRRPLLSYIRATTTLPRDPPLAMTLRILGLAGALIWASISSAQAGVTVRANGSCGPNCSLYEIRIAGIIDHRTREAFLEAVDDPRMKRGPRTVSLNSPGGSIQDAIAIGEAIRAGNFTTFVSQRDECSSACVLILAAGVKRIATFGKVGLHRPRFDEAFFANLTATEARTKYEEMADGVRQYLARMGMANGLYVEMLRIASDKSKYLSYEKIREYGLEGEDAAWAEWERAKAIQLMGRPEYEVHQSFMAVLLACLNSVGHNPDQCGKEVRPLFETELDRCIEKSSGSTHSVQPEPDYIYCAKAIEGRLIERYR
jgi:ATP-dependent protease ClpP protease subunit